MRAESELSPGVSKWSRFVSSHPPEEPRIFRCSATDSDPNFFFHVISMQVASCPRGRRLPAPTYVDYGFWKGVFGWYL